jgi:hypothetical protein
VLAKEKGMEQAREEFIEGLHYHQMYFSDACWKNDQRVVARNLGKLTSDASKYNELKESIMIQVKDLNGSGVNTRGQKTGENTQSMSLPITSFISLRKKRTMTFQLNQC